jgi:hypothetical protein
MTRTRYWWQNDKTWTTREGETLALEHLTPIHRARILALITRRALPAVRGEMGWELAPIFADAPDDALAEMDRELDVVDTGTDEDILARMPLVCRLRELDAQDAAAAAAREVCITNAALEHERACRRSLRVASRKALTDDIVTLTQIASGTADQATLTTIRDQLASTLISDSARVSYLGRERARDVMKGRVVDHGL